jgi:hypothetical protein
VNYTDWTSGEPIEKEWAMTGPTDPALEHQDSATCWCQPVLDYEDPVTGGRVYVHRGMIDGPAYVSCACARDDDPSRPKYHTFGCPFNERNQS